jgi:hypothetical protein
MLAIICTVTAVVMVWAVHDLQAWAERYCARKHAQD